MKYKPVTGQLFVVILEAKDLYLRDITELPGTKNYDDMNKLGAKGHILDYMMQ